MKIMSGKKNKWWDLMDKRRETIASLDCQHILSPKRKGLKRRRRGKIRAMGVRQPGLDRMVLYETKDEVFPMDLDEPDPAGEESNMDFEPSFRVPVDTKTNAHLINPNTPSLHHKPTPKVAPIFTKEFRINLAKHATLTKTRTPGHKRTPKASHSTQRETIEKYLRRSLHSTMPGG